MKLTKKEANRLSKLKFQAESGDALSQFELAKYHYNRVNFYVINEDENLKHSINWIVKSANQGHRDAYEFARQIQQRLKTEMDNKVNQINNLVKDELENRKLGQVTRGLLTGSDAIQSQWNTLKRYSDMLQKIR